jgi:RNA polymerase sigma-70 factor (ECF subfamily)
VFQEHSAFAWRLLARLGVEPRDVPDVCQEVFIVVHRRLADFDAERSSLRTWVYGICVRAASEYRRRHPNRRESELDPGDFTAPGQPDSELEAQRAWQRLAHVLAAMDPLKRQVFVLYELEALPMSEVATILQCPEQTAYSRLHAARRLVLTEFEGSTKP